MGQDYYDILNIPRNATFKEINKAYRKLSLHYHPKNNLYSDCAYDQFLLVSEAYDVLSDDRKRGVYDQFGEEGLKRGVPISAINNGCWSEGYVYHGNPQKTFKDFYGTDNPFQEFFDHMDADLHLNFGGIYGRGRKRKDEAIERFLMVTLEEMFYGCVKKMKISKRVTNPDGRTTSIVDKILTVYVKRGMLENTKIIFSEEGDEGPNSIPADLVFILKDRPHSQFKREGYSLVYRTDINLGKAIVNCIINIKTLDDRILHIPITEIVHPNYTKTVEGEGMPLTEIGDKKGDLIIKFDLVYPRYLKAEQKLPIDEGFYRT